jgi:sodium/potassium-transporting ATPase subunit alpha
VTDVRYRQATTACLTAIVLMQVVNVHLCRSRRTSIVSRPLFGNTLITSGIVAEVGLILAIDYTASGNAVFGTAGIGYEAWLVVLPFAVAMLALEEAQKVFVRWRERKTPEVLGTGSVRETAAPRP